MIVNGAALAVTAALYYWTSVSRVALFWSASFSRDRSERHSEIFSTNLSTMAVLP